MLLTSYFNIFAQLQLRLLGHRPGKVSTKQRKEKSGAIIYARSFCLSLFPFPSESPCLVFLVPGCVEVESAVKRACFF